MKKTKKSVDKKRHGLHHNRGKHYTGVYLPYLPAALILSLSLFLSSLHVNSARSILAYATNTTTSGLLSSTNDEREAKKLHKLSLNPKLSSAALAKAKDMVKKDYWSHNTPSGDEPWTFINKAGYKYLKAGENLAYGFSDSSSTVTGWMNSPSHKANLLDSAFTEVGFGFANSNNFNGDGPETVVVAMYAKPQVQASQQSAPAPAAPTKPAAPAIPPDNNPSRSSSASNAAEVSAPNSEVAADTVGSRQIARIETLTGGRISWALFAVGLASGAAVTILMVNHGLRFRKLINKGESLILHHPVLDVTMVSIAILGIVLAQNVGVIR